MKKLYYSLILILSLFIIASCSTESTPVYQLNTSADPVEGGSVTPSEGEYEEGEQVEITASPNEHWVFQGWQGDHSGSSNPASITIDADNEITALFTKREYSLTVTTEGEGSVSERVVQQKSTDYPHGTLVELTANPFDDWVFIEWNGDVDGDQNPNTFTITDETNINATFKSVDELLNIEIDGDGDIELDQEDSSDNPSRSNFQITAVPSEGWKFVEWIGDINGNDNPLQITIDGEKNITVKFSPIVFLGENGVTVKCPHGEVGDNGIVNGVAYEVVDKKLLEQKLEEGKANLNKRVCVTLINDMSGLFQGLGFNQDISDWDVSNVTDMNRMFYGSSFNHSISLWDVSNVTNMEWMFDGSAFNQPIGDWDVSNVTNMSGMFIRSQFNQPIGDWDVSNVIEMSYMFNTPFNQPIGDWEVSNVTNMTGMFLDSEFNQPIGDWDVSNVTNMRGMFEKSQFNQPIGDWDVSNVTRMGYMFMASPFNQNISSWCVWRIGTEPNNFSSNLSSENKPVWGTCPD